MRLCLRALVLAVCRALRVGFGAADARYLSSGVAMLAPAPWPPGKSQHARSRQKQRGGKRMLHQSDPISCLPLDAAYRAATVVRRLPPPHTATSRFYSGSWMRSQQSRLKVYIFFDKTRIFNDNRFKIKFNRCLIENSTVTSQNLLQPIPEILIKAQQFPLPLFEGLKAGEVILIAIC